MDSFNQTEECSSSESGWTKYIVSSPSNLYTNHDDQYFSSGIIDDNNNKEKRKNNSRGYNNKRHDIEDVDSLTSDASSGPSVVVKDDDDEQDSSENKSKMFGSRSKEVKETRKQGTGSGVKGNSKQTGHHVKKR